MQQASSRSITLVLGGVRSGKSRYAQRLAEGARRVAFVATAERRDDDEMRKKIERHRADRPAQWTTIEEPLELASAVAAAGKDSDVVIIDCLTLFAANLLEAHGEDTARLDAAVNDLCAAVADAHCSVVLVSNEVGSGIVPAYALGRRFRDLVGEINQRVAEVADVVLLMVAGLPLALKGRMPEPGGEMTGLPLALAVERLVSPPSEEWRVRARAHLDTLTKPLGSLGRLEDLAAQMVAIRQEKSTDPVRKSVYVFAADHGVTAEGVSAYPREVTRQMVLNFVSQGAAVNVLAKLHGTDLRIVDVGVDGDLDHIDGVAHRKIRRGTRNILHEAAMSEDEVSRALAVGAECADEAAGAGCNMVAIGEMGIGNTTAASTITCALTGCAPVVATGRGTGLDAAAHARKVSVVETILTKHFSGDAFSRAPMEILRRVGGLEIAAMTGMILAAASHRLAVIVDGFISASAAALAVASEPNVRGYLVAGHRSQEPGHQILLDSLKLAPVLTFDMRLGEGSGAVLAMPILESAMCLYQQMATFASAGVSEAAK